MSSFYSNEELKNIGFKNYGENVLVSKKASIYGAKYITLGDNVRIDDFCCLVSNEEQIVIGSYVHIAFFSILVGGGIVMEDFSGLSSRVSLYSVTDDYSGETLTNPTVPEKYQNITKGPIVLRKHVIIGTNTTILPNVIIGTGTSVGANSLVTKSLDPWGIYFGVPVKRLKERKKNLLKLEEELSNE